MRIAFKIEKFWTLFITISLIVISDDVLAQLSNVQAEKIKQYEQLIKDNQSTTKQKKLSAYYSGKMASIYLKASMYNKAINSYKYATELNAKIGNDYANRKLYNNIAMIYSEMNQLNNTQKYFEKSLNISRMYNDKYDIAVSLMDVSTMHIYKKKYHLALELLEESLKISSKLNDPRLLRTCYNLIYQCYKAYGDDKKAKEYKEFFELYDKQVNEQGANTRDKKDKEIISKSKEELDILATAKRAKELELKLFAAQKKRSEEALNNQLLLSEEKSKRVELEKKQVELEKDKAEKEKAEQKKMVEYQKALVEKTEAEKHLYAIFLTASLIGAALLLLVILLVIYALREKRKSNELLEKRNIEIEYQKDEIEIKNSDLSVAMEKIQLQNKSIIQSINYAQRIQESMLPSIHLFEELFEESFIFFKPRDIVSGDFYWFTEIIENNTKKILVAAVDCTGHGVPGAFMSMLGFNLLSDIVKSGITELDQILANLNEGIKKSLNQEVTENKDGMDMAMCKIDNTNKIVEFAGAQNPLVYVQDGNIQRIRGDKFPIGGFSSSEQVFTKHTIIIDKPTSFYMFSDGYSDQFGGKEVRKFMSKNMRELIFEVHKMPMEEQKNILSLVIEEWKGKVQQTDDILVLGFKLDLQ